MTQRTLVGARALAHALRPAALDDVGLIPALRGLANEYAEIFHLPIQVQADPAASRHLAPNLESAIFRIAQEALTNACKHAGAEWVRLALSLKEEVAELLVEDNGRGFDLSQPNRPTEQGGLGLYSMRERATLIGGELSIDAAPGSGTRIVLLVPVKGAVIDAERQDAAAGQAHTGYETTVLLVDDHAMFREGLRAVLGTRPGITVIGEAEDGHQAIQMVEALHPDIVVMDIAMPNLNGFDATVKIRRRFPNVRVIILTTYESRDYLARIVKVGAAACVLKRSAGTELVRAIEAVAQGQNYVSPTIAGMLLEDYRLRIEQGGEDPLTDREREVLQLVAEGRTNQEIARQLVVSVKTVEGHRTKIMRKLGAHDRTELVKYAIRMGMITPD
jgi:DNA-binding NarL/FixJ family response regulator/anti-sigma regulatory factor (Ser/Thr protein kinase)